MNFTPNLSTRVLKPCAPLAHDGLLKPRFAIFEGRPCTSSMALSELFEVSHADLFDFVFDVRAAMPQIAVENAFFIFNETHGDEEGAWGICEGGFLALVPYLQLTDKLPLIADYKSGFRKLAQFLLTTENMGADWMPELAADLSEAALEQNVERITCAFRSARAAVYASVGNVGLQHLFRPSEPLRDQY